MKHWQPQMDTGEIQVTVSWFKSYKITGCIFLLFWDFFSLCVFWQPIYQPALQGNFTLVKGVLALLTLFFQLLAPNYWLLTQLLNTTKVTIHNGEIMISHGPLPCWKQSKIITAAAVQYLWVEESVEHSEKVQAWNMVTDEIYNVKAMLRNGCAMGIFFDINSYHEAQRLRARIRTLLQHCSAYGSSRL